MAWESFPFTMLTMVFFCVTGEMIAGYVRLDYTIIVDNGIQHPLTREKHERIHGILDIRFSELGLTVTLVLILLPSYGRGESLVSKDNSQGTAYRMSIFASIGA